MFAGLYKLKVEDNLRCSDSVEVELNEPKEIILKVPDTTFSLSNFETSINPQISPPGSYSYSWSDPNLFNNPFSQNPTFSLPLGLYNIQLKATNDDGCFAEDDGIMLIVDKFIPNTFSPNGDGLNDKFGQVKHFRLLEIQVFNRWGEIIYTNKDGIPWDGKFKESLCKTGIYGYQIILEFKYNKVRIHQYGNIFLMR